MRYTQGIAFDGAAILDNGVPITIEEILYRLNNSIPILSSNRKSKEIHLYNYPELRSIIDSLGSKVSTPTKEFGFLPYWFEMEKSNMVLHLLGSLPKELQEAIQDLRSPTNPQND
jgi:hypothetical protein